MSHVIAVEETFPLLPPEPFAAEIRSYTRRPAVVEQVIEDEEEVETKVIRQRGRRPQPKASETAEAK